MKSLRGQLLTGILTGLTLLLGAGGTAAYFHIKDRLSTEFDSHLIQRARSLAAMIEIEAGQVRIDWLEAGEDPETQLQGLDYYRVGNKESGEVLAVPPGMIDQPFPRFGGTLAEPELRQVALPGDRPGRGVGFEFQARPTVVPDDEPPPAGVDRAAATSVSSPVLQLVIAKADTVAPALAAIRRPLIGLWGVCTVLAGFLIRVVVKRSLAPLDLLKMQIRGLKDGVSGQRIALPRQPAELEPVTGELNRLLARIEAALVREKTLTSNVAHELRTPIAGLLSILEVTLGRLRSAGEYRESTQECFEIAKRMHWLVNNLLSISRIEAGTVELQNRLVPLERALPEWWEPFAGRAEARQVAVSWAIPPEARLETDPEFLRIVMTNLFDNAVSYTPEGGRIRVAADADGNISVANQAVDLSACDAERAFDPFWRKTESRDGEGAHAGLGLNLCKKIIELLGGRISARIKEAESLFEVRLEMA